jgi:hypothetical protein
MRYRRTMLRLGAALLGVSALPASALANNIEAVPTGWRMENYIASQTVVLWFTGASECTMGKLAADMSQDDYNRLWSLVMTAKATGKPVGIYYNASGGVCTIGSFYAP